MLRLTHALALAAALLLAPRAGGEVSVSSTSFYCDTANNCLGAPTVFGPGATSQHSQLHQQIPGDWLTDSSLTADFDSFAGYARASGFGTLTSPGTIRYSARSVGTVVDQLTVGSGGGAATLRMTWHLIGVADVEEGSASFSMGCTAHPPGFACPGAVVTAMAGGAYDQPLAFDLPVVLGTPFRLGLSIGAGATVSASSVGPEVAFAVSASGEWGVQLVAVEVLDALGQPQPGVPIASESGFDWAAVPEPDASSGAAVAALALGACATRRRLPLGRK